MSVLVLKARASIIEPKLALLLADMAMFVGMDAIERVQGPGKGSVFKLDEVLDSPSQDRTVIVELNGLILA